MTEDGNIRNLEMDVKGICLGNADWTKRAQNRAQMLTFELLISDLHF
jgi:hypothetical protein